jgi:hypothetical protein
VTGSGRWDLAAAVVTNPLITHKARYAVEQRIAFTHLVDDPALRSVAHLNRLAFRTDPATPALSVRSLPPLERPLRRALNILCSCAPTEVIETVHRALWEYAGLQWVFIAHAQANCHDRGCLTQQDPYSHEMYALERCLTLAAQIEQLAALHAPSEN